jgi:hypothetical protein
MVFGHCDLLQAQHTQNVQAACVLKFMLFLLRGQLLTIQDNKMIPFVKQGANFESYQHRVVVLPGEGSARDG